MISESRIYSNRKLYVNILIGLGLISIPILSSPDAGAGFGLFKIPPFQRNFFSYFLLMLFFYASYYYIIPKFYIPKRWLLLGILIFTGYMMTIKLPQFLFHDNVVLAFDGPPGPEFHSRHNENSFFTAFFAQENHVFQFIGIFALSFFLRINDYLNDIKNEKLSTEISYLKSQINPHFLFNTLNSLYALALTKSSKTPEAILKLSGLMRYVVTESSQKYIQLEKEVDYIRNFIELQRLRLAENVELICHLDGDYRNLEITPLILISIIENAFKYGLDLDAHSKISISVCIEKGKLILNVENSIAKRIADKTVSSTELGLANTRKQLRIFYPEKHVLTIENIGEKYKVNLEIQLK